MRLDRQGPAGRARRTSSTAAAQLLRADGVAAGGRARPGHRGADLRRHRSGALRRQPIERPDGLRAGRRGAAARRRGDAGRRARRTSTPPHGADGGAGAERRRHARGGDGARRRRGRVVMAAAVADYTPAAPAAQKVDEGRRPADAHAEAHQGHPRRARQAAVARAGPAGAGRLCRRNARRASRSATTKLHAQGRRSDRRQRRVAQPTPGSTSTPTR